MSNTTKLEKLRKHEVVRMAELYAFGSSDERKLDSKLAEKGWVTITDGKAEPSANAVTKDKSPVLMDPKTGKVKEEYMWLKEDKKEKEKAEVISKMTTFIRDASDKDAAPMQIALGLYDELGLTIRVKKEPKPKLKKKNGNK